MRHGFDGGDDVGFERREAFGGRASRPSFSTSCATLSDEVRPGYPSTMAESPRRKGFVASSSCARRPIRNVDARDVRRACRPADVGAKQREIAGVARPAPVVDLAAVVADARGRRVDETNVAELEPFDEVKTKAAVEALELAARARAVLFAARDAFFFELFERALAG